MTDLKALQKARKMAYLEQWQADETDPATIIQDIGIQMLLNTQKALQQMMDVHHRLYRTACPLSAPVCLPLYDLPATSSLFRVSGCAGKERYPLLYSGKRFAAGKGKGGYLPAAYIHTGGVFCRS